MFKDFKPEIKLFLLVALIAVVISVAGILLLRELSPAPIAPPPPVVQQTPPPAPQQEVLNISTWQTYRNEEFGFEFQYPKEFAESQECKARMSEVQTNVVNIGNRINITIGDSKGMSLEDFVSADFSREFLFDINQSEQSVGGEKAITISYRVEGTGRLGTVTFIKRGAKIYQFDYLAGGDCAAAHIADISELDVLSQILSTFRFVK